MTDTKGTISKVSAYLQEHILGEITSNTSILEAMSTDGSPLRIKPELVIYPRVTNDLRKIARFCWQLAEKGHILPLTVRGGGTDTTGAAIGGGIILSLPTHLHTIYELDIKQKLVRAQPGASAVTLNEALHTQGLTIPTLPDSDTHVTIGGVVANNSLNADHQNLGSIAQHVSQLEVVLANGDILQTKRLSRRELSKKQGLTTLEGDIYRGIDNLIEENKDLIDSELLDVIGDNSGYSGITRVKHRDGSFDLTPLFVGSQGTLGIISELILQAEFYAATTDLAVVAFKSADQARDCLDQCMSLDPSILEYYDGALFEYAAAHHKTYSFFETARLDHDGQNEAVVVIGFNDFNEHIRQKKIKRVSRLLRDVAASSVSSPTTSIDELQSVRDISSVRIIQHGQDALLPPVIDGAFIPRERFEEFAVALSSLSTSLGIDLPIEYHVLSQTLYTRPNLDLRKVGDKQKLFKLLEEFTALLSRFGGSLVGEDGEGRIKAHYAYQQLDPDVMSLYEKIKELFDPYGLLNPGVKQDNESRQLIVKLRSSYTTASLPFRLP